MTQERFVYCFSPNKKRLRNGKFVITPLKVSMSSHKQYYLNVQVQYAKVHLPKKQD